MGFPPAPPYSGPVPLPASLNGDAFELHNIKLDAAAPAKTYDSAGSVTPYLGLRARLSQVWFNRYTLLLLLLLFRMVILTAGLRDDIDTAQEQALAACSKVEDVGSAMASMPHYLSVGVNELAASSISHAVRGLVALLEMILTGVEQIILFVINFYIGTFVCLTSALVHGALDIGIGAANEVTDVMNEAIQGISQTLEDDVAAVQNTINEVFDKIESASSIFGASFTAPTLNLTGPLAELGSIEVDDTSFVQTLVSLNASVPTYDDAAAFAKNAISIPFKSVREVLNTTYGGYAFDESVFPVAKKTALTFCSDNDTITGFFAKLFALADKAKTIFCVVIALAAVLAAAWSAWQEIRAFRRQQQLARVLTAQGYDAMDVVYMASRPYSAQLGIWVGSRFADPRKKLLGRWTVAYATTLPALFVLTLALTGFVSSLCQYGLLKAVQAEAPALAAEVADFAGSVVQTLASVSNEWATDANGVLGNFEDDINRDVLGYVVNATQAVNDTLNTFTDEIDKGINAVFDGTVLENTVRQIVRCLIGIKIDAIEDGLTWVHDHAHIALPAFPNNTFSIGAQQSIGNDSASSSAPSSFLASGNSSSISTDDVTAAVDKVVAKLESGLVQAVLVSLALLLVYVVIVLVGLVWALARSAGTPRTRAEGGQFFGASGADPITAAQSAQREHAQAQRDREHNREHADVFFPQFAPASEPSSDPHDRDDALVHALPRKAVKAVKSAWSADDAGRR